MRKTNKAFKNIKGENMKKFIEKYVPVKKGFSPLFLQKEWQVAILSFMKSQKIENIDKVEMHKATDEVFLLSHGPALLITAEIVRKKVISYKLELMKPDVIYNIPKKVWHNLVMKEDTVVFIVEKRDTHKNDVTYHYLQEDEKKLLQSKMKKYWVKK